MSDLHARLLAAIDAETALAEAASPGPWSWRSGAITVHTADIYTLITADRAADAAYVARVADPASTLRRLAEDRDVLARHATVSSSAQSWGDTKDRWYCEGCDEHMSVPHCPERLSVARRHHIEVQP